MSETGRRCVFGGRGRDNRIEIGGFDKLLVYLLTQKLLLSEVVPFKIVDVVSWC